MDIVCTAPDQPPAIGKAVSRANASMAGNFIVGGIIGALVDHGNGTAYTYPTWIEMTFGRTLVFDRGWEKTGMAVTGLPPGTVPESVTGQSNGSSLQCSQQLPGTSCPR